jgi:hypothetical protein
MAQRSTSLDVISSFLLYIRDASCVGVHEIDRGAWKGVIPADSDSANPRVALVPISLVFGLASTVADAQRKPTRDTAARDVSQSMNMMDKEQNGTVSKQELMDLMSQKTFDRLDINRSGQLERTELRLAYGIRVAGLCGEEI